MDIIKRVIFIIFIFLIFFCSTQTNYAISQTPNEQKILLLVNQNGKKGLQNTAGEVVLKPEYQDFGASQINGMLAVKRKDKWGVVDKDFKEIIKPAYDEVGYFYCGWCPVRVGKLWGLIDTYGNWIVKPTYNSIELSQEKKLAIVEKNGKYGLIDSNGKLKIKIKYDIIGFLGCEMLTFVKNRKTGMVNENGVEIFPAEYEFIYLYQNFSQESKYSFYVELHPVYGKGSSKVKSILFEKSGKVTMLDKFEYYYVFNDEFMVACDQTKNNTGVGLVDVNLNPITKQVYTQIMPYLDDEFIAVKYGRYHGTISKNGEDIIKPIYTFMEKIGENLVVCKVNLKGGKWGVIDKNGKIILPIIYSKAKTNGEFVCFEENGLWGIANKKGEITLKPKFSQEPIFTENNLIVVRNSDNAGFFNVYGESLTKEYSKSLFPFEDTNIFLNGFASVKLKGKWGVIDLTGNLIIPCQFDHVGFFENGVAWVANYSKEGGKYGLINTKGDFLYDINLNDIVGNLIIECY